MGKIKVNEIEKHDATEVTVNSDVVMAAGTSVSSPSISTDTISEKTSASGVTIDGVKLKDSVVEVDTISEKTTGSGVTIDGVELKDGSVKGNGTGRKNYIINGNFDIWQRGTSGTGGYCSADRWFFDKSGGAGTFAQGSFTAGQTDVPNNPKYYANITMTSADDNARIEQKIEDVYTLAGETITISFWAKYTTNAPTSFNTQINQNFGSGGSTAAGLTLASGQTLTTSWQKFTVTGTLPSISGKTVGTGSHLIIRPIINTNNETFDYQIAQVQVEKGSVATDFEVRPIGEELNLCERYYQRWEKGSDGAYEFVSAGGWSGTQIETALQLKNTMRAKPTISHTGTIRAVYIGTGGSSGSTINANHITTNNVSLIATSQSVNGTAGRAGTIFYGVDSNSYLEADAEL